MHERHFFEVVLATGASVLPTIWQLPAHRPAVAVPVAHLADRVLSVDVLMFEDDGLYFAIAHHSRDGVETEHQQADADQHQHRHEQNDAHCHIEVILWRVVGGITHVSQRHSRHSVDSEVELVVHRAQQRSAEHEDHCY